MEAKDSNDDLDFPENGQAVVALSKALFADDMDSVFEIIGKHMDQKNLRISEKMISEFRLKGRISMDT